MTIQELKNWIKEQFEQGNNVALITAGQGGSGYALAAPEDKEAILDDVDRYDDNEIKIVESDEELAEVRTMIEGLDELINYDAVVKLNDGENILYVLYWDDEYVDVCLEKGNYNTGDTLTWMHLGKQYSCSGEFYVDNDNILHHTFITPSGREIEIVTPYE